MICDFKPHRRTGSAGNKAAVDFFARTVRYWNYEVDTNPFECLDYFSGKADLTCGDKTYPAEISPFSLPCYVKAELVKASSLEELERVECADKILLIYGDLASEPLMPKNFVFYNPEHHQKIYALLEAKKPAAVITATGRNPEKAGALYPFPLIEDGDFDIPSVYCADVTGEEIAASAGKNFTLKTEAARIKSTASNVIAGKIPLNYGTTGQKIVFTAHIDTKDNTPGASDDASGIVVLLLLAEMLADYEGDMGIEFAALNGEDYYNAAGEMDYLSRYAGSFERIALAVNIDGAGYKKGHSAYSFYECPEQITSKAKTFFSGYKSLLQSEPWHQGDHMIFVQKGRPAIAVTSEKARELMLSITHTPQDTPDIIDCHKLVDIAKALQFLVRGF